MHPPDTRREDGSYTLHGDTIEDPYRWLEGDDEAVQRWVDAQNEYADARLGGMPAREALRPRMAALARTVAYEPVRPAGGRLFQRVRGSDQDHAVLTCRGSLEEERRELLDPNGWSEDGSVSMNWYAPAPAPDGEHVAYGVDEGGRENYDVHVLDVESGEDVEMLEGTGRSNLVRGAWKGEGFYYTVTGDAEEGGQLDKQLRYHALGTEPAADLVIHDEFPEQVWPAVTTDPHSDHVVVRFAAWDRSDVYHLDHGAVLAAHAEGGDVSLEPLVEGADAQFEATLAGDDLYLRTTLGAPNYRVARVDLGADERGAGALETVVPEGEATVDAVAATDGRLFVARTRDVVSELTVTDREGSVVADVDLPGPGTVADIEARADADAAFATYQSFDHPRSTCRLGPDGGFEVVDRPDVDVRAPLAVEQEWFASADGTEVPAFVVHREDVAPDGTNPAVLYGYGGFDISLSPSFRSFAVPFLEDGGVLAVANLRGGGEFGEEWHHAARRESKERTFEDFAAAAEHLLERGWAAPGRLACHGGSNGGLTVGATITRRPELFAAAVCEVPLLDMLRFHTSLLGASWTGEYGDPEEAAAYEWLRDYSPYHHVDRRRYPDVLFTTAEGDSRVDPFHARKTAARMQARAEETLVLLKTYGATGHGVGKPVSQAVEEQCDKWGFVYDRLDVDHRA